MQTESNARLEHHWAETQMQIWRAAMERGIQFVLLSPTATQPRLAKEGDCGFDLVVSEHADIDPHTFVDVHSGIAMALPEGLWARITGRSSTLRKRGLLVNEGVIDTGYTGELYAGVWNLSGRSVIVEPGERLAQVIIHPVITPPWRRMVTLPDTQRGSSGFGSSGL